MTPTPGSRLAHYEIAGVHGAGGMGEVYRARDTRLGRDVAVKVLPDAVAKDAERLARFEREARTVAALSHPNIVLVHSIEEHGGLRGSGAASPDRPSVSRTWRRLGETSTPRGACWPS
jgi:hypothetical protein